MKCIEIIENLKMTNFNPYASKIFDKLAQLKQWQSEQHELLLRQQEQQRELLEHEREVKFENYEKENNSVSAIKAVASPCVSHLNTEEDELGVSYLSNSDSEDDCDSHKSDSVPVSPTVLSENVRNRENITGIAENIQQNEIENSELTKPKFAFLKRGAGLSRFRLSKEDLHQQSQRIKASKAKPGAKKTQNKVQITSASQKLISKNIKLTGKRSRCTLNSAAMTKVSPIKDKIKSTAPIQSKNVAQNPVHQLNGKLMVPRSPSLPTLQLNPVEKATKSNQTVENEGILSWNTKGTSEYSKKRNSGPEQTTVDSVNNTLPSWASLLSQAQPSNLALSPADSSKIVEQRELRLFERLERIADDSSFCSSSSIVTKFIEGGYISSSVQSTPQTTPSKEPQQDLKLPMTSSPLSNPILANAKSLLQKLAAYKFPNQHQQSHPVPPVKENINTKDIQLDLQPTPINNTKNTAPQEENWSETEDETPKQQHVRFKDTPQIKEIWPIEGIAWSDDSDESCLDSSTDKDDTIASEPDVVQSVPNVVLPITEQPKPNITEEEESDYSSTVDEEDDQKLVGTMVHARLEQLRNEVLAVQRQQTLLASQRAELEEERIRLSAAIAETEEERKKLEVERVSLGSITKKRQNQEREEIKQLKNQLEELQVSWKAREARWAAAQASQRTQLRQLSQENKQLAFQIKQLKLEQGKKVRFAPIKSNQLKVSKPLKQKENTEVRRVTLPMEMKLSEPPSLHIRTRSASPSVRVPSSELEISKAGGVDKLIAKYKNMYETESSPSTSLVLDTPRKINKAYSEMFSETVNTNEHSINNSIHLSDEDTFCKEPVISNNNNDTRVNFLLGNRGTPQNDNKCDKEIDTMDLTNGGHAKNSMHMLQTTNRNFTSKYCPPKLSIHSDSVPYESLVHEDGTRQLWFPSGNTLKISPDALTRRVVFHNGDIQETLAKEGVVRYFYAETKAWHETFSDGTQTITFPDGQKEITTPSGRREVKFADQIILQQLEDGRQTAESDTGAKLIMETDGTSVLILPNGIKETRTREFTQLEYPDGTVRTRYPNGMLETKYSNGRVRMKDSSGKLIMDTHSPI